MNNISAVKKQVELLREYYNIDTYPEFVNSLCGECDLENYLFSLKNELYYEQIMLSSLGIEKPIHRASLLGFPADNGIQWFIVDPTYGQFFRNKKFADYMLYNHKDFSEELLNNGYMECTLENIYTYIHGFMFSNAFVDSVDTKVVYKNLYDVLLSMKEMNDYEATRKPEPKKKKRKCLFKRKRNH